MANCPMCLSSGIHLKDKCHTIPRCLILQTKVDGKNVYIEGNEVTERNWHDEKGALTCEQCEKKFALDDEIARKFIIDKEYTLTTHTGIGPDGRTIGLETYDPSIFVPLKKFLISVVLRQYFYNLKYENSNLLGPHFEKLRNIYSSDIITRNEYPVWIIRYQGFELISRPSRSKPDGFNTIVFILNEFRFELYVDKRHQVEESFQSLVIGPQCVSSLIVEFSGTKLERDILKIASIYQEKLAKSS